MSKTTAGETSRHFDEVLQEAQAGASRRQILRGGLGLSALSFLGLAGCGGGELRLLVPPVRWGEGSGGRRADAGVSPRRAPPRRLASATVADNGGPRGEEREGKPCADSGVVVPTAGTP